MSAEIPAGWYTDRLDPSRQRWWDGADWSHVTREAPGAPGAGPVAGAPVSPWGSPPRMGSGPVPGSGSVPGSALGQFRPEAYSGGQLPAGAWVAGPITPDGIRLAGVGQRLLARILDALITLFLSLVFGIAFLRTTMEIERPVIDKMMSTGDTSQIQSLMADPNFLSALQSFSYVSLGVSAVYTIGFIAIFGATPGKAALGLRVRTWEVAGRPAPWRAVLRWVGREGVSALPLVGALYYLVDALWVLFDRRRQGLHDKVASTVVVRIR